MCPQKAWAGRRFAPPFTVALYALEIVRVLTFLLLAIFSTTLFSSECGEGCYTIELNFDIEDNGYEKSAIFISGYTYGLMLNEQALRKQGKANFFCKDGDVVHKEILDLLNAKLSGVVSADLVAETAKEGLRKKYPCN